jgi:hypothetical protein
MTVRFKSFYEFKEDYEEDGFIDKISTRYYPLKQLNDKQIQRYYLQYAKKWDKAYVRDIMDATKEQSEDSKLSAFVRERDRGCRLLKILTADEQAEWEKNHNGLGGLLDAAHVFGKAAFPWMRFDEKNVVTLNRFSHYCLDRSKSPVNGEILTDDQRKAWWQRIVGNENDWEYLELLSRQRKRRN